MSDADAIIRPFRDADRDVIVAITLLCFENVSIDQNLERLFGLLGGHTWQERKSLQVLEDLTLQPEGAFVAEVAHQPVGYITTRVNRETHIGWIPHLAVHPDYQRRGIGRRLIQTALDYFRSQGMVAVRIETLEQNPIGQRLYPALGFKEIARQIHYARLLDDVDASSPDEPPEK